MWFPPVSMLMPYWGKIVTGAFIVLALLIIWHMEGRINDLNADIARCEMRADQYESRLRLQSKLLQTRCEDVIEYYRTLPPPPGNGRSYLPDADGVLLVPEPGASTAPVPNYSGDSDTTVERDLKRDPTEAIQNAPPGKENDHRWAPWRILFPGS